MEASGYGRCSATANSFAWHLYREAIPLFDPDGFLRGLGPPSSYSGALADVASFQNVLASVPLQLAQNENNAIYEAGLVYVCIRNIAMAASWILNEFPDFSRYSAFNFPDMDRCPISVDEFKLTMACRMASQRGLDPPQGVSRGFVLRISRRLDPWVRNLHALLQRNR
jgi:hypothetical protein